MISTYEFGKAFFRSYNQKKQGDTTTAQHVISHQSTDVEEHLITDL